MHYFTEDELNFIKENLSKYSTTDLATKLNQRFELNLKPTQIRAAIKNRKWKSGRDTRFKPGQPSHNKGLRGINFGGKETQYKPGQMPWNYKPVGTERINRDGYVEIKTADPKKWRAKHVVIWEAANGPVPKGHAVIFGDGDRSNLSLDNLLVVSRRELAVLNKKGLIQDDTELTKSAILVADIYLKMGKRK